MVSKGLFVRLEAKPGKERDIEILLKSGLSVVDAEPGTVAWYGRARREAAAVRCRQEPRAQVCC